MFPRHFRPLASALAAFAVLAAGLGLLVRPGHTAQKKPAPDPYLSAIAPFLNDNTQLLVCFNLEKFDLKAITAKLASLTEKAQTPQELAEVGEFSKKMQEAVKLGARRTYLVLQYSEDGLTFFSLMPCGNAASAERVLGLKRKAKPKAANQVEEIIGSVIAFGDKKSLEAIRALKPRARPDIAQAHASVRDTTFQVLLVPNESVRESVRKFLTGGKQPPDPKDTVVKAVNLFLDKAQWAALGLDLGPNLRFRFVVEAQDAEAARSLEGVVGELLKKLGGLSMGPGLFGVNPTQVAQKWLTPKRLGKQLVVELEDPRLTTLLRPALKELRKNAYKASARNNYKQIALAMWSHYDTYKHLPMPAIYSKDGKPLLSWRVAILPYLDQSNLYKRFNLDEPWDSPQNLALLKEMPAVYAPVGVKTKEPFTTFCQVFVGPGTAFEPGKKLRMVRDFPDGISNTILLAEAGTAVPWTKPADMRYDPKAGLPKLGGLYTDGFPVAMCDGHVLWVTQPFDRLTFRLAITRNDGQKIDWNKLSKDR